MTSAPETTSKSLSLIFKKNLSVARAKSIKLYSEELSAEKVNLNWTAFEKYGRIEGPLTEDRKQQLLTDPGVWYGDVNPWKFADAFFNKVKFKEKIFSLKKKINY